MKCLVVTPERTVVDVEASSVTVPLYDGEIGILPGHTPLVGRVGAGELRVKTGSESQSFYVEGGFVEVLNDTVSLMTVEACPVSQLNRKESADELATALALPSRTPELAEIKSRRVANARARLRSSR
ncbi:MAG: ATP synthase F1 subunit epsilon [Thermoguttaceae bacterium]